MPSIFIRGVLFFCSYFPLTLIICVLQYDQWPWWVIALLGGVLGCGSLALTAFYFWWMRRTAYVEQKKVTNFSKHDSEVMSYIASYLIPFVTFPLGYVKQILTLVIFVGVLLVIYVHSNMIYINPMLSLCGYHLYEIEVEHSERTHYYIARKPLERNREIRFVVLSDDIYLEK
ncbi:MAG: hypothetical protein M3Y81_22775 [Chloroflexota bacterium]|nr:hypothetical protein [Chloroflexota bacterium]